MIIGAHVLLYSENPEADRAFFRDVLKFPYVEMGEGWLIFALPPSEAAVHPIEGPNQPLLHADHRLLGAVLYLMCSDLQEYINYLKSRNVSCTEITQAPWGIKTTIKLPSGSEMGLYQPTHPTALNLGKK